MASIFLNEKDIEILTGRKRKSHQIESLRALGIQFYVNASGHPVVPISAIEGRERIEKPQKRWEPNALKQNMEVVKKL